MESLSRRITTGFLDNLTSLFVDSDIPEGSTIELVIKIRDHDLNVREFSTYLSLADRVYARMSPFSLGSYARMPYRQLRITRIRSGSIEAIISESISNLREAAWVVALGLFLKYILEPLKTISETKKNFADANKSIEEAKLTKETRKKLKEARKRDEFLENLTDREHEQLTELIRDLRAKEKRRLPASKRFARKNVEDVKIVVKKKK